MACFGERVRQARIEKGMTLQAVADLAGLSPDHLYSIERSHHTISLVSATSIILALGLDKAEYLKIAINERLSGVVAGAKFDATVEINTWDLGADLR